MDPTVRLLRLVALLQQRPEWAGPELADRLEVTPRTVRRDISRLRDLGYAVDAVPARGGGYRLRAGSALPPLVLTDDEAVVLAVGLRAATLSGVSDSSDTAVSALAKLEQLLPGRLRARVAALGEDVISLGGGAVGAATDPAVLAALALACRRAERVALAYTDARGATTRRDVDAYRVVHAGHRWYLVAHDVRRAAWRTFRVDRVGSAELLGGRAVFDDPPDAGALVAEAVTTTVYRWIATVRLDLPAPVARRAIPPTVGQVAADTATSAVLRLGADDLDWLARYLVGLTCDLEVLDPPELIDALRELGSQLAVTGPRITGPTPGPG
ncbi:helix-turn-helix transcriptional regulator [Nitriliruptor alkaliphilus]|uniref:helix-turn-helix transcriptional regulator n=1 Tax=Nitriliruptor alkaliphilus TaxID=427918 RepID=UPI000696E430|nr:YafY family protein [Nitriliruptor alkaliphilus]